jgi:hypothetical protein
VCDEHGIGGSGEYYGEIDAQLDRINVLSRDFWRQARALRGALRPRARRDWRYNPSSKLPLGEFFSPGNLVNHTRRQKLGQRPPQRVEH